MLKPFNNSKTFNIKNGAKHKTNSMEWILKQSHIKNNKNDLHKIIKIILYNINGYIE